MQQLKNLLKPTLLTSLAPLSLYALISLSEHLLRLSVLHRNPQNNLGEISFDQDNHKGSQVLISLFVQAKTLILNAYSSFFSFFIMMVVMNLIHLAGSLLRSKSDENRLSNPSSLSILPDVKQSKNGNNSIIINAKEPILFFGRYQRIIQRIVLYGLFYYCFNLVTSAMDSSTMVFDSQTEPISLMKTLPINNDQFRLLSQEEADLELLYSNNLATDLPSLTPDIRRLSIGKSLSSLRLSPIAVTLSKDNKFAFIILRYSGSLKVIDISDDENPIIIGSLENLAKIENYAYYDFKKLTLSADGKTLFATNVQSLEIIDVSDPQVPTLKTKIEDPVNGFKNGAEIHVPKFCIPTMALSSDETTLYVAAVGLQIYNVTNTSNPEVLYSYVPPKIPRRMTSLALLPNSKTLIYANGTLDFYDVSNPRNPQRTSFYSNPDLTIHSIRLSKSLKKVYAVGLTLNQQPNAAILEEIDISQRTSLGQYPIAVNQGDRLHYPSIIGLSPNETNIFVMWGYIQKDPEVEFIGFDLTKKELMTQQKNLFSGAKIFLMVPGTNNIITNSNNQFQIIKLFKDYPNTISFCLTNNSKGVHKFPTERIFAERSEDNKYLFTFSKEGLFESYDLKSPLQEEPLTSFKPFNNPGKVDKSPFRIKNNLAIFQGGNSIYFLDISDPTRITTSAKNLAETSWAFRAFTISPNPNENFLVAWARLNNDYRVKLVDFSNFPTITETPLFNYTTKPFIQHASISNKGKLLYFIHGNFTIYNISDPKNPKMISSKPLAPFESSMMITSQIISPDDKTLFILFMKSQIERNLAIIDVSDVTNPKTLSVTDIPTNFQDSAGARPFILTRDAKRGFVITDKDLLVFSFHNLTAPAIIGMISFQSLGIEPERDPDDEEDDSLVIEFSNFFLSADEKTGYLADYHGKLFQVSLDLPYTLYLPQEKFLLGRKSSENLLFLGSDNKNDFVPMRTSDFKTIKVMLYDLSVFSTRDSPVSTSSTLPPWITFDYDNQALTVESKKQRELGSYTLYSFSSKKVPRQVFGNTLAGGITSEDMVTLLVSLGYLDNQRFLTSGFGAYEDFLLPSNYSESQETIYKTLQSYRIETFTGFTVNPSLTLSNSNDQKFVIKTPSEHEIKVGIKLQSFEAKFLQKTYSTLQPVITEQKSRLTIEGPLELVNEALKDLVINLNNPSVIYAGEITINDQMNPPISLYYKNISEYFFKNEVPKFNTSHNLTLQQQIDLVTLYTGQSFSISIDPQTFIDNHNEQLSYELIREGNQDSKKNLPNWITYQGGLTIKGIPPEDWMTREIRLVLIVKNEFKQIQVPFTLDIHISMVFAAKLVMRYSPMLLTALGLLIKANQIINIVNKKKYRHSKDVSVRVGEEITSSVIFPMRFIAEEKAEGELILRNLLFSEKYNEEKIKAAISNIVNGLDPKAKEKFKLYFREGNGQNRVEQYVLHQVVLQQLDSTEEKATKALFENVKEDWPEFVEYDEESSSFKINDIRLENLIAQIREGKGENGLDEYLLSNVNHEFLKKALIVYAAKQHEIEEFEWKVAVELKMKTSSNPVLSFLKMDLQKIPNSEKSQIAYGIGYRIQEDHLIISGTPHANFEGKTVVLQVFSERQRIRKELWIHGVSSSAGDDDRRRMSSFTKQYNVL